MAELKPCPFCGNSNNSNLEVEAKDHGIENRPHGYRFTGKVTCLICGASAISRGFEETAEAAELSAINAWNRRSENDTLNNNDDYSEDYFVSKPPFYFDML